MVERKQDTIVANASKTSKWAFILEFILVFLAVTLSFLVDNWREKQGRKESERQHMRMLLSDLKEDIHRLDSNSVVRCNREKKTRQPGRSLRRKGSLQQSSCFIQTCFIRRYL